MSITSITEHLDTALIGCIDALMFCESKSCAGNIEKSIIAITSAFRELKKLDSTFGEHEPTIGFDSIRPTGKIEGGK